MLPLRGHSAQGCCSCDHVEWQGGHHRGQQGQGQAPLGAGATGAQQVGVGDVVATPVEAQRLSVPQLGRGHQNSLCTCLRGPHVAISGRCKSQRKSYNPQSSTCICARLATPAKLQLRDMHEFQKLHGTPPVLTGITCFDHAADHHHVWSHSHPLGPAKPGNDAGYATSTRNPCLSVRKNSSQSFFGAPAFHKSSCSEALHSIRVAVLMRCGRKCQF